jgi:hypothetical protein
MSFATDIVVTWTAGGIVRVAFPLTPALSLRERESLRPTLEISNALRHADRLATILPLPEGEGRGEGEPRVQTESPARDF